ncbi:MAG: glycine betaine ABC transporter substrate-binding protein [Rudaea sp.]
MDGKTLRPLNRVSLAATLAATLFAALIAASCSSQPTIVVASKNFTEQVILGEIIAAQIERRLHVAVDRKLNLGGTLLAHEALLAGSVDLYPEYTGTALTEIQRQPVQKDARAVFEAVQAGYRKLGISLLAPLGFNDTFAMVVRMDLAQQENLKTLSDAARLQWKIGVGYEFTQRPDGLAGLVQAYGLKIDGDPVVMDLGLLYAALKLKQVDLAAANATDGMLGHPEFVVLEDDRHYFPPYQCAIAVREATLKRFPGLEKALGELSGRITDAQMRRMNEQVDIEHRSPAQVAHDFLETWQ